MRCFIVEFVASVPKGLWTALGICSYLFFFALILGIVVVIPIEYIRLDGIQTQGTVVGFQACDDSGGALIRPLLAQESGSNVEGVVQFFDLNGQKHQTLNGECGDYSTGQVMNVWYLPENIDTFSITDSDVIALYIMAPITFLISVPFVICLLIILIRLFVFSQARMRKRAKEKASDIVLPPAEQEAAGNAERTLTAGEQNRVDGPPPIAQSPQIDKRTIKFAFATFLICLVIAGSLVTATLWGFGPFWYPRVIGVQARATVVGVQNCPGSAEQRITVQFIDAQGKRHNVSPETCFASNAYHEDQTIALWYLPNDLGQVVIRNNDDTGPLVGSSVLAFLSLITLLVWAVSLFHLVTVMKGVARVTTFQAFALQ